MPDNSLTLAAWRAQQREGYTFTTPSGLHVTLKRVSLLDLVEQGEIPTPLAGMVEKTLDTATHTLTVKEFPQYARVVNMVVKAVVTDPPVADDVDDEHLSVEELPIKDRLAIYNWANSAERLRPFRSESGEPAAP